MNIFINCFLMLVFTSNWFSHCKNCFSVIRSNGGNRSCAITSFSSCSRASIAYICLDNLSSVPYVSLHSSVMIWKNCNIKTELTLITINILIKSNLSIITITITSISYLPKFYCFSLFIIGTGEWVCDVHLLKIIFMYFYIFLLKIQYKI